MPNPSPEPWKLLDTGMWFFLDSPDCTNRYSVQEKTRGGFSLVCSTCYHNERGKQQMLEIVEAHNSKLQAKPSSAAPSESRSLYTEAEAFLTKRRISFASIPDRIAGTSLMAEFAEKVKEHCAQLADYSASTFDDSDDPYGFTRNAVKRLAERIRGKE